MDRRTLIFLPFIAAAADLRRSALQAMEQVMGPLPRRRPPPLNLQVLEEVDQELFVRRKITYLSEPGDRVPAYLLVPKAPGRRPAAVCLHQTTKIGKDEPVGLGGKTNLRYALELARRGWITVAPDYPRFGDYQIDPYGMGYASATMKGIWNHMRAVDLLGSLPQVDRGRIAAIGHSLGGHNALFLAAFDSRVKRIVTSCGFTSFAKYYGGDLTGWSHRGYMPRIASEYGKSPARMPFDFDSVFTAIGPRAVFINAPKQDSNFEVSGVDDVVRQVAARFPKGALVVEHPDCGHDFPPDVRERAYAFLESGSFARRQKPEANTDQHR